MPTARAYREIVPNDSVLFEEVLEALAAELAQMKGQMIAIEQASTAKKCGIQFQGKPEGKGS
jgi:hypothetical protein